MSFNAFKSVLSRPLRGGSTTTVSTGAQATSTIHLNDNRINEIYIGVAGASGFSFGNASYDLKLTHGKATQNLANIAAADPTGPNQYGSFNKINLQGVVTSLPFPKLHDSTVSATTNIQWANRNLVSAEQLYVGGGYQMRGWQPQILGGARAAYLELALNTPITAEWSTKLFLEGAEVQANVNNYSTLINGVQVNSSNGNSNFISDAGLSAIYRPMRVPGLTVTGTLAGKFGKDPVQFGQPVADNSNYRAWLRILWAF